MLPLNGLKWLIEGNPNVAVEHVLSAIRPKSLRDRLTSDLSFAQQQLKKDVKGFLKHSVHLAEAFQLFDAGPTQKHHGGWDKSGYNQSGKGDSLSHGKVLSHEKNGNKTTPSKEELPVCLYEPHQRKGIRHLLKDCRDCPIGEQKRFYA